MEYVIATITTRTNTTHKSRRMMYLSTTFLSGGAEGPRERPLLLRRVPYATFTGVSVLLTAVFTYEMIPAF